MQYKKNNKSIVSTKAFNFIVHPTYIQVEFGKYYFLNVGNI